MGGGGGERGERERKHLSGDLLKSGLRHFTSEIVVPQNFPIKTLNWAEQQDRQLDNFFYNFDPQMIRIKILKNMSESLEKKKKKKKSGLRGGNTLM